jgi:hypothetical protein
MRQSGMDALTAYLRYSSCRVGHGVAVNLEDGGDVMIAV